MGAKYAEQTEFTLIGRKTLESKGIDINFAATISAQYNLGISGGFSYNNETLKK